MKELRYINQFFIKYKYQIVIGVFITVAANIFKLYTPKFIGACVDLVKNRLDNNLTEVAFETQLINNILLLLGAACVTAILTFFMRQTIINVSRYIEYDLKNEIYKHYQILSLNFYKSNRTGDLMSRISEDVGKVRNYTGPALMYTINTITLFTVVLFTMYNLSPKLTYFTVIPLPILSFIIYKISRIINKRSTIVQQSLAALSSFTQEHFSGISVIKSYGIESRTNHLFNNLSTQNKIKQINLVKIQALFFPLMILLIGTSNLIVIWIGGSMYINDEIQNLGIIVEFLIYVNLLTWPVATVGWVTDQVQQAEAAQKRINEFLKQEPEIKNNNPNHISIEGNIEFKNVSYTYPDTGIKALKELSFKLESGKTLAILGKTGSGKSTVLDLVGRLYDTSSGDILIDGEPINSINLYDLRESIGYVPQDAFLFSDSIINNIKFGKEDATDEEVIEAAKNAKVHDNIVEFKNGYDTILGERGITLSGGQKQRVSIARAIIKTPKILLFDDCLSAVDTETEEQILKNLLKISANSTTIIVSHRVSSAKNADYIIVLDDGRIIESGTHESLSQGKGYYQTLYEKQLSEKVKK